MNWTQMSPTKRLFLTLAIILQVTLLIAAQWDIQKRPEDEIRGSKSMWRMVAFINFIGPLAYFLFGRQPQSSHERALPTTSQ